MTFKFYIWTLFKHNIAEFYFGGLAWSALPRTSKWNHFIVDSPRRVYFLQKVFHLFIILIAHLHFSGFFQFSLFWVWIRIFEKCSSWYSHELPIHYVFLLQKVFHLFMILIAHLHFCCFQVMESVCGSLDLEGEGDMSNKQVIFDL